MKEVRTKIEQDELLPGNRTHTFVVLFWRSNDPSTAAIRQRCRDMRWPSGYRAVAVDLDRCPELAAWFRPERVPMLAVVWDGALLAVEFDMNPAACERLIGEGQRHVALLNETF